MITVSRCVAAFERRHIVAVVALSLGVVGCGSAEDKGTPEATAEPRAPTAAELTLTAREIQHGGVKWAPVDEMTAAPAVEVPGQLQPDENRTVRVSAPAQGRLLVVRVNVGDRVDRGQPVAMLQSEAASSAGADPATAVAELSPPQPAATFARVSRERAERLLELKAGSRQDVERARTDDEVAQGAVVQATAEVVRAKEELERLNVDARGEIVLRSSIAGVVLHRDAVAGSVVEAGATLLTISDTRTLWLQIAATEAVASAIRPATLLRFSVTAFPNETFEARVQSIGEALDPATRTLPVRAVVSNATSRLRPEMFAAVLIEQGSAIKGFGVPDAAVQWLDEHPVVFVARPDRAGGAAFARRDIEIGAQQGGRTQVLEGVRPGDLVVTDGAFAVKSQFSRSKMPS
jgi:cobalt-zinc-cadmium efflux system membrane fusion protein